jgi:hypothetical protein
LADEQQGRASIVSSSHGTVRRLPASMAPLIDPKLLFKFHMTYTKELSFSGEAQSFVASLGSSWANDRVLGLGVRRYSPSAAYPVNVTLLPGASRMESSIQPSLLRNLVAKIRRFTTVSSGLHDVAARLVSRQPLGDSRWSWSCWNPTKHKLVNLLRHRYLSHPKSSCLQGR